MLEEQLWQRGEGAPWLRRQKWLRPFQVPQAWDTIYNQMIILIILMK